MTTIKTWLKPHHPIIRMLFICAFIGSLSAYAHADQSKTSQEDKIKAGLIYNFIHFTRWPDNIFIDGNDNYNICVLGEAPYEEIFKSAKGTSIQGRKIKFNNTSIGKLSDTQCLILILHDSFDGDHRKALNSVAQQATLTISESSSDDAMISLNKQNQSISFDINQALASNVGITFSAKMLRLASSAGDRTQ